LSPEQIQSGLDDGCRRKSKVPTGGTFVFLLKSKISDAPLYSGDSGLASPSTHLVPNRTYSPRGYRVIRQQRSLARAANFVGKQWVLLTLTAIDCQQIS
jgi:hypothetical protein